ncbi:MAG TPA: universal stress protein [Bryobacteraceae bacterium]|jgi:nucleotide-binding universal stress UspA family protein
MLPFRKILYPIDYSEPCGAIVPYVREAVHRFSAELTLVHAYGPEALASSARPIGDPELPVEARDLDEQRLRQFAQKAFPGQHVESIVEIGEAGSVIDRVVQREGADLVMLATHGRGPVRRLLLGSVTAKILHDLSAAVWTGTGRILTGHTPAIPYKSILCAVDETDEAEAALHAAASLANAYGAKLHIVHVVELPPPSFEFDFGRYEKELTEAAKARLRELKAALGIDAPHAVIAARVADGVREEAVRTGADLIVTGRGRSQRAFNTILSRLYPIVRHAPCPVLSI